MSELISNFIKSIKDQIDLNIESNNCKNIYELYKDTNISIPKVYYNCNIFIIMEYLEGDDFDRAIIKMADISEEIGYEFPFFKIGKTEE